MAGAQVVAGTGVVVAAVHNVVDMRCVVVVVVAVVVVGMSAVDQNLDENTQDAVVEFVKHEAGDVVFDHKEPGYMSSDTLDDEEVFLL